MSLIFVNIEQFFDMDEFQELQDNISTATGVAVVSINYAGIPITKHSNCCTFCQHVRNSQYGKYCEMCDSRGGIEATRLRKPYLYRCHAGLIDFAVPLWVKSQYLGAIMGGQIQLDAHDPHTLEQIMPLSDLPAKLTERKAEVPSFRMEQLHAIARMMMQFGNLYVQSRYSKYFMSAPHSFEQGRGLFSASGGADALDGGRNAGSNAKVLLEPAMEYIDKHLAEKFTVQKLASVCGISPSYFSKLFIRENLYSVSEYCSRKRVELAIKMLQGTTYSVRQIAEHLGYDDSGYFIKVFKKITGYTPLEYQSKYCY